LGGTQFQASRAHGEHLVEVTIYTCPHCRITIELQRRQFCADHTTSIDPDWRSEFDAVRPLKSGERVLDFPCPQCAAPVRILYECDRSAGSPGDLREVLEAADWVVWH
jgi:predicted RNA-binding Zn-ribbon protein involved in translation (DUF1610 family)